MSRAVEYRPDPGFEHSQRYKRAVQGLAHDRDGRLPGLTERERLLVRIGAVCERWPTVDQHDYGRRLARALRAVQLVSAAPQCDVPTPDLIRAWSQPEAQELWRTWWNPAIGQAYAPAYEGTKAAMVTTAGLRRGPHFKAGWDVLRHSQDLRDFFIRAARAAGHSPPFRPALVVREYSACTRHLERLSEGFPEQAMRACTGIVRTLADLHPDAPIGQYLVVDGTAIPAWCPQRSAKRNGLLDEDIEARYRKRTPEADFRFIGYDRDGQFNPEQEEGRTPRSKGKSWRGYTLVLGCDLVTGLPMVGSLHGAAKHEPHSAPLLMQRLYKFWPESPLRAVVADKLFDDNPTHKFFETHYAVHLVAHRRPSHIEQGGREFPPEQPGYRGGIARITGEGVAYCRVHEKPLLFEGTDTPSRAGLAPGEATTSRIRSRFRCEHGCGRLSLPTDLAWSALPYYPLNPLGRPALHAMRTALLAQRNVIESAFASMKGSYRQGNSGASRTRIFNHEVHESLIWISLLTRGLLTLADQRDERAALQDLAA